ncbi:hypothetical protein [Rhodobacteraceae bacterium DSL-40]|uniref:hypothetical protein n=1 Tax=Amaricoccus sp. B4 TaxID=3368557 RepID=UPI000DAD2CAA
MTFTIEELTDFWMPKVARAGNGWASGFARSIIRQSKRPAWEPSRKQLAMMRRLVSEMTAHEDFELIEN